MRWLALIIGRLVFGPPRIAHNPVVPHVYVVGHKDQLQLVYMPPDTQ